MDGSGLDATACLMLCRLVIYRIAIRAPRTAPVKVGHVKIGRSSLAAPARRRRPGRAEPWRPSRRKTGPRRYSKPRSEERRVGKGWVSTWRSGWWPSDQKKKSKKENMK